MTQSRGFTLLEIVIAIAILAVVFTSLYSAYSSTLDTTEMVARERDVEQAARLGLMRMADDLASLYSQKVAGEPAATAYRFVGGDTEALDDEGTVMEFTTSGRLDFNMIFPSLRINRVRYVLEEQADNQGYYRLVRHELPFAGLGEEEQETAIEVVEDVEKLTVAYLDKDGQMRSQWDSELPESEEILPRLVYIRLQLAGDKSRFFAAKVALPKLSTKE